ncbi:MAG: hypothetical protein NTZ80_04010, partial [Patescibacteria group bacterium]|nr:hypothetical protein [Patescibacteria group bacterium]
QKRFEPMSEQETTAKLWEMIGQELGKDRFMIKPNVEFSLLGLTDRDEKLRLIKKIRRKLEVWLPDESMDRYSTIAKLTKEIMSRKAKAMGVELA